MFSKNKNTIDPNILNRAKYLFKIFKLPHANHFISIYLMYEDKNLSSNSSNLSSENDTSVSEKSSSLSDHEPSGNISLTHFDKIYFCKQDIKTEVVSYHNLCRRRFKVIRSESRRYYVGCSLDECHFKLHFNFRHKNFSPPDVAVPHTCNPDFTVNLNVFSLIHYEEVISWFVSNGRKSTIDGLRSILEQKGINATRHTLRIISE